MKPILLLITATIVLAGCVTPPGDEPVEAASAPAANATLARRASTLTAANGTLVLVETPFAFDGKVPLHVEACAMVMDASCLVVPMADWSVAAFETKPAAPPTSATAVATWSAAVPTNEEMVVFAYSYNDDEWQSHGWAMGASGVTLELESMEDFVEGGTLIIGLSTPNIGSGVGPAAAWGGANLAEQAFHLEGVVVAPGPAPAA